MQIFLYEWITAGGLMEHHGPLPGSLLRQGKAMVEALAEDAANIDSLDAVMMRDIRVHSLVGKGAEIVDVDSIYAHQSEFDRLVQESDLTILIAPETDSVLFELARRAENLEAKLISPSSEVIKLAGDKQETAKRLQDAKVSTPQGIELQPEDKLPQDFDYPAVLKPTLGAGSEDTVIVNGHLDSPLAYAWPRRLETYVSGKAVSVSLLGSPSGEFVALPPTLQRLSTDGHLEYLGGSLPLSKSLADRAMNLAMQSVKILPNTVGYVGVDLILGNDPDGNQDYAIEINPRLTTSYIGLRYAIEGNLLKRMIDISTNKTVDEVLADIPLRSPERGLSFDADGSVYDSN